MTWLAFFIALFRGLAEALGIVARQEERQAGADANQVEAQNAEIDRITRAAAAGQRLPIDTPDPFDRDQ